MINDRIHQATTAVVQVTEVDAQTDPCWEAFVATHPDGTIYHHPVWLEVLAKVYGYKPAHLACKDATGQIRGALPLFHTRGLITGNGLASPPRTPVAGPLALDSKATTALLKAAVRLLERAREFELRIREEQIREYA